MTFSHYFTLWGIRNFEDDIKIEFGVFFAEEGGDIFIEFADAFPKSAIEMIFDGILVTKFK